MSQTAAVPPKPKTPRWRDLRLSTRLAILATLAVGLLLGLEILARLSWRVARGVPPLGTGKIEATFYPEWKEAGLDRPPPGEPAFDVLVLAASVWHSGWGDLAPRFQAALSSKLGRPVRVTNLSFPGRTTLDSLRKYRLIRDRRFDLVVVYDAINDLHMNNCPESQFRDDYAHAPRFRQITLLDRHPEHPYFVLPYSLRYLKSRLAETLHIYRGPGKHGIEHGRKLKTEKAFRANMEAIVALAKKREEPVVLMTFASYFPADYTEERFQAKALDYGSHASPVRFWGTTETVPPGIAAHNAIIRELAKEHGTLFLDAASLIKPGKANFDDCCHLAPGGRAALAEALANHLGGSLARAKEDGR